MFAELGDKFVGFVDVLSEVSERTAWLLERRPAAALREVAQDRKPPAGQLLVERGVVPNASVRSTRVQ